MIPTKGKDEKHRPDQLQFDKLCSAEFGSFIQRQTKVAQDTQGLHRCHFPAAWHERGRQPL